MNAPCVDCQTRYVGCHANCDRYKAWKAEQMTDAERVRKDKRRNSMLNAYTVTEMARNTRKKRKER